MADELYLRRPLGGTPSATVFHGWAEEEPVLRRVINESRLNTTDWDLDSTDHDVEHELPRGKIMARELSAAGRYVANAQGTLLVPNGTSGNVTLKVYGKATNDPIAALGGFTLLATHTVAIADPGTATSIAGMFDWQFELLSYGQTDATNAQGWTSTLTYQRWTNGTPDTVKVDRASGQLAFDARTADWIIAQTVMKAVGLTTTRIKVFGVDSFVRNGQSGQG